MASMREVAKKAEVSLSTVSVVLNQGEKRVSPILRERVLQAAKDLGYRIPVKKRKNKTIAVLIPHVASLFFTHILSGITDIAREEGYDLLVKISGYNFNDERAMTESILKEDICGLIIDTVCPIDTIDSYFPAMVDKFSERNIPLVVIEQNLSKYNCSSIFVDNYKGAYNITRHLAQMGHKKIAHITGIPSSPLMKQRLKGYKDALKDFNIAFDSELVKGGDYTPVTGFIKAKELVQRNMGITAIFGANDQTAIGVIKALKSEGYSIPDDIAVAGFDNLSITTMIEPSLTTMSVPAYQMGIQAVKCIIEVGKTSQIVELPCKLLVRKSTSSADNVEWDITGW